MELKEGNDNNEYLTVFVKSIDENKLEYRLNKKSTVEELKHKISKDSSLPLERIRLIFKARNLSDNALIGEIVSEDNQVFHLVAKLSEQPPTNTNTQEPLNTSTPQPPNPPTPQPLNLGGINFNNIFSNLNQMLGNIQADAEGGQAMPDLSGVLNMFGGMQGFAPQAASSTPAQPETTPQPTNPSTPQPPNPPAPHLHQHVHVQGTAAPGAGQGNTPIFQFTRVIRNPHPHNHPQAHPAPHGHGLPNNSQPRTSADAQVGSRGFAIDHSVLRQLHMVTHSSASIPIEMPRAQQGNPDAALGEYLRALHSQLFSALPQLLRASNVLTVNPPIRNTAQRNQALRLIQNIGTLGSALKAIGQNLENLSAFNFTEPETERPAHPQHSQDLASSPQPEPQRTQPEAPRQQPPSDTHPPRIQALQEALRAGRQLTEEELEEIEIDEENRIRNEDQGDLNAILAQFSQGVPLGMNIEELMRNLPSGRKETDIIALISGSLSMVDIMSVFNDQSCLDRVHPKIKSNFQKVLIDCQNNREKIKDTLFKTIFISYRKTLRKNKDKLLEIFDYRQAFHTITEEYFDRFREILLADYTGQVDLITNSPKLFSKEYLSALKSYFGKIGYLLSKKFRNGIEDTKTFFYQAFTEELQEMIGMQNGSIDIFSFLWQGIEEGIRNAETEETNKLNEEKELQSIIGLKQRDAEIKTQPALSQSYLQGKLN